MVYARDTAERGLQERELREVVVVGRRRRRTAGEGREVHAQHRLATTRQRGVHEGDLGRQVGDAVLAARAVHALGVALVAEEELQRIDHPR
jgi:hypothetical protein